MRLTVLVLILLSSIFSGSNAQVDSFRNEAGSYLYTFDSASIQAVRAEVAYLREVANQCDTLAASAQSFLDKELELRQAFDLRLIQKDSQIALLEQTNLLSLKEMELAKRKEELLTSQITATEKRHRKRNWAYAGYGFAGGIILGLLGITALR